MTYEIDIAGLKRDLPLCPLNDELAIGAFVLNGATLKYQPIDYLRTGEWEVVEVDEYTGENYMSAIWNVVVVSGRKRAGGY